MDKILENHKLFIIVVLVVSFMLFNFIVKAGQKDIVENEPKLESNEEKPIRIQVDIKGCIKNPGVYEFLDYQRVNDALKKAGGLTNEADTSNINLSKKLEDEMVIYVSSKEEIEKQENKDTSSEVLVENSIKPDYNVEADVKEKSINQVKVSLNKATLEELMTLPKIGESKARAIIEYRKKTPFAKIEDLKNVSGIGDATYELLKDQITL